MDAVEALILKPPFGPELAATAAVLILSLVGAPWLRTASVDHHAPSLIDRWKLFSWLHPVSAALLTWTVILALGAMVCIPAVLVAERYDLAASASHAVAAAIHQVWRTDRSPSGP